MLANLDEERNSVSHFDKARCERRICSAPAVKQSESESDSSSERISLAQTCRRSSLCSVEDAISMVRRGSFEIRKDEIEFGPKIGEGAMAVVFKATWRGKPCAAKMLKSGCSQGTDEYNDLLAELSILTSIGTHKNLVQFYGAHICDPREPIIVQELVDGPDLEAYLEKKPVGFNLGKRQVHRWALDILSALDHLHDRDPIIMHRDLKPANILLSQNFKVLKLTDFGLAKQVSQHERMLITHAGNTGTPRYMAPEVYGHFQSAHAAAGEASPSSRGARSAREDVLLESGDGDDAGCGGGGGRGGGGGACAGGTAWASYTEKADIYSASLVIWYLLTGVQPSVDISKDPLGRPSASLARGRCPAAAELLQRMWHVRPEVRPSAGACALYLAGTAAGGAAGQCCSMQ